MPRTRAPGKRSRASRRRRSHRRHAAVRGRASGRASKHSPSRERLHDLAFDMEEPLNEAINYVHALQLIGHALSAVRADEGRPVELVARTAIDRLAALKETWNRLLKTMRSM